MKEDSSLSIEKTLESLPMAPMSESSGMGGGEPNLARPSLNQPFLSGSVTTPAGEVPQVASETNCSDRWGTIKARWGVGRMAYTLDPGLYALGHPDKHARVFVSANYKMSFDRLRESLAGRAAWILVLDTKGINVWCAAGKGTFGTEELMMRIEASGLAKIVAHKELILPQLAGPGVAAHLVKKFSGFKVVYGPIKCTDLAAFLDAGLKATPEMRQKTFDTRERIVLIPVELVEAVKWFLLILPAFFLLGGLGGPSGFWTNAANHGLFAVFALISGLVAGAVLTPLLLPWLPGRAFSLKAAVLGFAVAFVLFFIRSETLGSWQGNVEVFSWFLIIPAVAAYLGMNFTGASTYTSLSGVKREMRWAVPLEIGGASLGVFLWLGSRFMA